MTDARNDLVRRIWRGTDPLADLPPSEFPIDTQGWASKHPYLTEAIDQIRPKIVVEVGVWKGGSVITMARRMKELGIDGVIVAVDTWLGCVEIWVEERWWSMMPIKHGRPQVQEVFMANVLAAGLQDYVLPLPIDSINASEILKRMNIKIDVLHIDAGHDYASISTDLRVWWPLLNEGGLLIGDDYQRKWPGVVQAFNEKFGDALEHINGKCRVRKQTDGRNAA